MKRRSASCHRHHFGGTETGAVLADILTALNDGRLSYLLRRKFVAAGAMLAALERVDDTPMRIHLEQLWVDDANRLVSSREVPDAVRQRFAACLRECVARHRARDASVARSDDELAALQARYFRRLASRVLSGRTTSRDEYAIEGLEDALLVWDRAGREWRDESVVRNTE